MMRLMAILAMITLMPVSALAEQNKNTPSVAKNCAALNRMKDPFNSKVSLTPAPASNENAVLAK